MNKGFPSRPPRLSQLYVNDPLYFVTFCTFQRNPILARPEVVTAVTAFAQETQQRRGIAVGRFVVMPDHVHLFVRGPIGFRLGVWAGLLKQRLTQELVRLDPTLNRIWQEGFFDHVMRSDESYGEKWRYVRDNPVRKGLVRTAEDWPYGGEVVRIDRA